MSEVLVGGSIFGNIKADPEVVRDLAYCLYCRVISSFIGETTSRETGYKIPLDCISGNEVKQCPSCKVIFILENPVMKGER